MALGGAELHALKGVSFDLRASEVVGLVGDNGAGKSTLIKILSGAHHQDQGQVLFEGKEVRFSSPRDASEAGELTGLGGDHVDDGGPTGAGRLDRTHQCGLEPGRLGHLLGVAAECRRDGSVIAGHGRGLVAFDGNGDVLVIAREDGIVFDHT